MGFKKNTFKVFLIISNFIVFLLIFINSVSCCISADLIPDFLKDIIKDTDSSSSQDSSDVEVKDTVAETTITAPVKLKIYIEDEIPNYYRFLIIQKLGDVLYKSGDYDYEFAGSKGQADFIFTIENYYDKDRKQNLDKSIFFVPVVSFYSLVEDITWQQFTEFWNGSIDGFTDIEGNKIKTKIIISKGVLDILEKMLGKCRAASLEVVKNYEIIPIIEGKELLSVNEKSSGQHGQNKNEEKKYQGELKQEQLRQEELAEKDKQALDNEFEAISIVPFDSLKPGLKVLSIDGVSVLNKYLKSTSYPLAFEIKVDSKNDEIPKDIKEEVINSFSNTSFSNRTADDIVTIIMTGVTALTRQIAARMDENGILYPAEKIADVLWGADITHISNEVSFVENCYAAKPNTMVFCSKPEYMELIKYIDADVIELTGNHLNDYGSKWLSYTIDIFDKEEIIYYGGGRNLKDAFRPALFEVNGYKFAFLGANTVGPSYDWAKEDYAGSTPINAVDEIQKEIDMQKFENIIADLKSRGYNVIFTFQYQETENYFPTEQQVADFERIINAGAVIVNGSQSHVPQGVEILDDGFINFGLGNIFFGQQPRDPQLALKVRQGIIAKHIFYKGEHINTVLISTMIEDASQPRVMTDIERAELLKAVFKASVK